MTGPRLSDLAARQADEQRLTLALRESLERGVRPPCSGPLGDYWISDYPEQRSLAVEACAACEVRLSTACRIAGRRERHGVWGGRDMTRRTRAVDDALADDLDDEEAAS